MEVSPCFSEIFALILVAGIAIELQTCTPEKLSDQPKNRFDDVNDAVDEKATSLREAGYANLSYKDLTTLLQQRGFVVEKFAEQSLLARDGDVAFYPYQVLPHLQQELKGWTVTDQTKPSGKLKRDRRFRYVRDQSLPSQSIAVLSSVTRAWTADTCVSFERVAGQWGAAARHEGGACDPHAPADRPVVCVGNHSIGCWTQVAAAWRRGLPAPKLSIDSSCSFHKALRLFARLLGRKPEYLRSDRDDFLFVKYENIDVSSAGAEVRENWRRYYPCSNGMSSDSRQAASAVADLPFDYASVMQAATSERADADQRPILVARNARYQYLLDYHQYAHAATSFFDIVSTLRSYGCEQRKLEQCRNNGIPVPKCRNFGFLWEGCRCVCPPTHTGALCEIKLTDQLFPLQRRAHLVEVNNNEIVDFSPFFKSMPPEYPEMAMLDRFRFVTIIANGQSATQAVVESFWRGLPYFYVSAAAQARLISEMAQRDCIGGVMLLWGVSSEGRLRRECTSTLNRNEPAGDGPAFRSWSHHMDVVFQSSAGSTGAQTDQLANHRLKITFEPHAESQLKTLSAVDSADRPIQGQTAVSEPTPQGRIGAPQQYSRNTTDGNDTDSAGNATGEPPEVGGQDSTTTAPPIGSGDVSEPPWSYAHIQPLAMRSMGEPDRKRVLQVVVGSLSAVLGGGALIFILVVCRRLMQRPSKEEKSSDDGDKHEVVKPVDSGDDERDSSSSSSSSDSD